MIVMMIILLIMITAILMEIEIVIILQMETLGLFDFVLGAFSTQAV